MVVVAPRSTHLPCGEHSLRTVGNSTVGFGSFTCYDGPAVTRSVFCPKPTVCTESTSSISTIRVSPRYLQSWAEVSSSPAGVPIYNSFCPELTTTQQARRFGVEYVLERLEWRSDGSNFRPQYRQRRSLPNTGFGASDAYPVASGVGFPQ